MPARRIRLLGDLLVSVGVACVIFVGVYALGSFAVLELENRGSCEIADDAPGYERADPSTGTAVYGDLRWSWAPPGPACAWALDDEGAPVGPPDGQAALRTEPKFGSIIGWMVAVCAALALTTLSVAGALKRRSRHRTPGTDATVRSRPFGGG